MANSTFEKIARELSAAGVSLAPERGGRYVNSIKCSTCDATHSVGTGNVLPVEVVVSKMHKAGWTTGRKPGCPACRNKRETKEMPTINGKPTTGVVIAAPAGGGAGGRLPEPPLGGQTPAMIASDAAKKAKRLVFMALEDYYDDASKRYKPGWSDDRMAKELGISEAAVANIREENFGPAGEPPEMEKLRAEFAAWEAEQRKAIAQARQQALAALDVVVQATTDFDDEVAAFNERIGRLVVANGWRS